MKLMQDVKFEPSPSNSALLSKKGNFEGSKYVKKNISKEDKKGKSRCLVVMELAIMRPRARHN